VVDVEGKTRLRVGRSDFAVLLVAWTGPISRTPSFTIESVVTTRTPARTLAAVYEITTIDVSGTT
jgi:hypothetical protein